MEDSFIEQAGFTKAYERGHCKLFVIRITLEMEHGIAQFLTEKTNVIFDLRAFWTMGIVKAIHAATAHQVLIHPLEHDISHAGITHQVIAIVTVFIELMQIDVIQTCAAVEHAIINDEAFEVEYAERFAGVNRDTINRHIYARVLLRHAAIPVGISVRCGCTNTAALSAMPVHQDANIQFRALTFGLVYRA